MCREEEKREEEKEEEGKGNGRIVYRARPSSLSGSEMVWLDVANERREEDCMCTGERRGREDSELIMGK